MPFLTPTEIQNIKEHMTDDQSVLKKKFNAKKNSYEIRSVSLNELDDYIREGWEEISTSKHKARIQKHKPIGMLFEDDIWCMFYNLGFRILNYDEKLTIQ